MSLARKPQVLFDRKGWKNDPILWRVANALFGAVVRRKHVKFILIEQDVSALQLYQPHERSKQCCLSSTISTYNRHHRASPQFSAYISQHGSAGEVDRYVLKRQHQ
jgi:hypothetical protein